MNAIYSGGFYFHLQPGGRSMVGGGLWMPPRPQLTKLRDAIAEDHRELERIAGGLTKRFGGLDEEHGMLKRMPRGYPDDQAAGSLLKYQSFTSGRALKDSDLVGSALPKLLAREFEALLPLVRWLNRALGYRA